LGWGPKRPGLDEKEGGTRMPVIRVSMWKGRTHEQKAELAKALTEVMVRIGKTSPEATTIIFEEIEKENWASGGVLVSDRA